MLSDTPTLDEVRKVVMEMDHSSYPGPDGFNGQFYSVCWDVIKDDLYQAILAFFHGAVIPKIGSSTLIITNHPQSKECGFLSST